MIDSAKEATVNYDLIHVLTCSNYASKNKALESEYLCSLCVLNHGLGRGSRFDLVINASMQDSVCSVFHKSS